MRHHVGNGCPSEARQSPGSEVGAEAGHAGAAAGTMATGGAGVIRLAFCPLGSGIHAELPPGLAGSVSGIGRRVIKLDLANGGPCFLRWASARGSQKGGHHQLSGDSENWSGGDSEIWSPNGEGLGWKCRMKRQTRRGWHNRGGRWWRRRRQWQRCFGCMSLVGGRGGSRASLAAAGRRCSTIWPRVSGAATGAGGAARSWPARPHGCVSG